MRLRHATKTKRRPCEGAVLTNYFGLADGLEPKTTGITILAQCANNQGVTLIRDLLLPAPSVSIVAAISAATSTAVAPAISSTVITAVGATATASVFATLGAAVPAAILCSLIAAIPPTLLSAIFALISTRVPAAVVTIVPIAAPAALLVPVPATIPVTVPFAVTAVVPAAAPIRVTATVVWTRVSAPVVAVVVGSDGATCEKCCRGYGEHEKGFHGDLRLQLANLPQGYRRAPPPVVSNRVPLRQVAA